MSKDFLKFDDCADCKFYVPFNKKRICRACDYGEYFEPKDEYYDEESVVFDFITEEETQEKNKKPYDFQDSILEIEEIDSEEN